MLVEAPWDNTNSHSDGVTGCVCATGSGGASSSAPEEKLGHSPPKATLSGQSVPSGEKRGLPTQLPYFSRVRSSSPVGHPRA